MYPFDTPYNYLIQWSLLCFAIPWFYSYFNEQSRLQSMTVEQAIEKAWEGVIQPPSIKFRKVLVGINCNVDIITSGVSLMNRMNISLDRIISDNAIINSPEELYETFVHFFSRGAPAERYMADESLFQKIIDAIEDKNLRAQRSLGGNAALMAQKVASSFPATTIQLVGAIGPRGNALLHPSIVPTNATRISQDEMHIILEYKQGDILGEYVAPASSRFITSHDEYSGSAMVIEMFFKAITDFRPNLILMSGIHTLEAQNEDIRLDKLRLIKRSLAQIDPLIPIHLQLGSMADPSHAQNILEKVIPYVDSLGLNEQELTFLSKVGIGPHNERYPVVAGTLQPYKAVDMLAWLMKTFGHDRSNPEAKEYHHRLQRIHFYSLTYHIMVSRGPDWSNLAAGLAAGARIAGRHHCGLQKTNRMDSEVLEIRMSTVSYLLDRQINKVYQFNPHSPIASWIRDDDLVFIYTPVLVCKFPQHTIGQDDAVSSTALLYSQFYKLERRVW